MRCYMDDGRILLFQYGSNMNSRRLNSRVRLRGAAKPLGKSILDGWGIRFDVFSKREGCGVTNMVRSRRERVTGVLYTVPYALVVAPRGERSIMDRIEGAGQGIKSNYERRTVWVRVGRIHHRAETYVGSAAGRARFLEKSREDQRVGRKYFDHLVKGAREFRIPRSYVRYLQRCAGNLK